METISINKVDSETNGCHGSRSGSGRNKTHITFCRKIRKKRFVSNERHTFRHVSLSKRKINVFRCQRHFTSRLATLEMWNHHQHNTHTRISPERVMCLYTRFVLCPSDSATKESIHCFKMNGKNGKDGALSLHRFVNVLRGNFNRNSVSVGTSKRSVACVSEINFYSGNLGGKCCGKGN